MAVGFYKGYSSHEFPKTGSFRLNDKDLIKMDLLNHIFTVPGERLMMPTYGTNIPNLAFEPLTPDLADIIIEELERVFDADPRVAMLDIGVKPNFDNNEVHVSVKLRYVEVNEVDSLDIVVPVGSSV